ncbi:ABC transporter permease subunit [Lysinibacillus sp. LZ02]|uniref:ABC transporter permease subunit n=1 Tax=Lysinibacillus sp. LZ02 TaxID=3420668 RepID=UPI003D36248A
MINPTIFKQTMKNNRKLWLIFTIVLCALQLIFVTFFDSSTLTGMENLVKGTPLENMLTQTSFLGMLAQTYYSIHGVIFPLIFVIMTANSLIAAQVDRGSMAYLLSTPTKRVTIVLTQAIYLVVALFAMILLETIVGVFAIQLFQTDADVVINDFLLLNVGLFLLMFATSGISFFFSSLFNLSKNSLAFGAGIPLAFFLCQIVSTVDASLENVKYVTINALFDTKSIVAGNPEWWKFGILALVGIVLFSASVEVFKRKDLPL